MRRAYFFWLCQFLTATFLFAQTNPSPLQLNDRSNDGLNDSGVRKTSAVHGTTVDATAKSAILEQYGKLPLSFEANHGQTDSQVKFFSRSSGYSLFLTGDEAVMTLRGNINPDTNVLRMKLRNANPGATVVGVDELAGTSNYFVGNNQTEWHTRIPTYAKVKYEGIYSGIDLIYYGNQRELEYDFIVAPGADPRRIGFDVSGAQRIRQDAQGDLLFKVGEDEIRWHKPVVYQEKDGSRQFVAARYSITDKNRVGFELAKYDAGRPLYIDPLIYSTFLGGTLGDSGNGIAVDSAGSAYVTGLTFSTNFPTSSGAFQTTGESAAFVTKLTPSGTALIYSTYLGGATTAGLGIAVDSEGNAYVTGSTEDTAFPTTTGAFQTICNGGSGCTNDGDAFVTKINPTGSTLVYSTYLGGSNVDGGSGITLDTAGNAYVTGGTQSTDFPTKNALQPANGGITDAFVTELNPTGTALVYSTYLGGSGEEGGSGIAVDSTGNIYVAGRTTSTNFPTKNPLQRANGGGGGDAFVTKIKRGGSALIYSTYLGGSGDDEEAGIALDSTGNVYIAGTTNSPNFPTTTGAYQTTCPASCAYRVSFAVKIDPAGSALVYGTFLGRAVNYAMAIAADSAGNAYVTGSSVGTYFPVTAGAYQTTCKGNCWVAFVTKLNPLGTALLYSTLLGGSTEDYGTSVAVDSADNAYITGATLSSNFPTTTGAYDRECNLGKGSCGKYSDAFVSKLQLQVVSTTTLSSSPNPSGYGQAVTFTAVVSSAAGAPPDGETVSFMKGKTVLGTGTLSDGSATFTTSTLVVGANSITAVYGGDSNLIASTSKPDKQVVDKATTSTTVASSLNPSKVGQSVTFTASVTAQFGNAVTGTVDFYDGTTLLKAVALSEGAAKYTTTKLTSGSHSITAAYKGNASFETSTSAVLTQTVD
jgi:Bacterial Ig-like domain (group 3)/Beta-propeller repeat